MQLSLTEAEFATLFSQVYTRKLDLEGCIEYAVKHIPE